MTSFPWPGLPWISQSCPADRDRATPKASSTSFPGNIWTWAGRALHEMRLMSS